MLGTLGAAGKAAFFAFGNTSLITDSVERKQMPAQLYLNALFKMASRKMVLLYFDIYRSLILQPLFCFI